MNDFNTDKLDNRASSEKIKVNFRDWEIEDAQDETYYDLFDPSLRYPDDPKYILVANHPEDIWNGLYTESIRDWNNVAHFEK